MHMRDDARPALITAHGTATTGVHWYQGLGRTTALALTALTGCGVLIALGATVSLCWMIHPLLSAVAGVGIAWLMARTAGRALRATPRRAPGGGDR